MAVKFTFKGKSLEELKQMELKEFIELLPSNRKRSLTRGFTEPQKRLLNKIDLALQNKFKKPIKTHCRNMVILPKMVGLTIHIHKGNKFEQVLITQEALGMRLGELALTRTRLQHSAPGVGATKSSSAVSVR